MVNFATHPIVEDLLPPLLALLPASFASPQPPPSLFPLLAPILRNRVRLLSDPSSPQDPWLSLLTWNTSHGGTLVSHLASLDLPPQKAFEPCYVILNGIKRLDEETLNASAEVCDWGLAVTYVWCTNDPEGEDDGWKVLNIRTTECSEDTAQWHPTVIAAEGAFTSTRIPGRTLTDPVPSQIPSSQQHSQPATQQEANDETDDDDDYWNMYDRSSVATPAAREVANSPTEEAYFERYYEVEPAIDSCLYSSSADERDVQQCRDSMMIGGATCSPVTVTSSSTPPSSDPCLAPRPLSSDSSNLYWPIKNFGRLEESANHHVQVEVAVKQHISTSVKSLYRLAKAAGIGRDEFEAIIHTEVSVLSMMDADDDDA